jgi:hypothetical protein
MDFKQLRDADLSSLEKLVKPWGTAAGKLDTGSDTATKKVGDKIRSGSWRGKAAAAAQKRVKFLETQTEAGQTEAEAIQGILKEAHTGFSGSQKRLKGLIKQVDDHDKLSIDDSGHVSVHKPGWKDALGGGLFVAEYIYLQSLAGRLNGEIKDTIADARQMDGAVATALRAAANLDEPDNLDFNPNAKTDGKIDLPDDGKVAWPEMLGPLAGLLPGSAEWYSKLAAVMASEPFAQGTPKQQSAGVGNLVKTEVERAGGQCKVVNGMMVCIGAPDYMYERGGTTYGDTFISPYKTWDELDTQPNYGKDELLNHEKYHRDHQWREYGVSFGRKYLAAEAASRANGYTNPYEADAEKYGGKTGYEIKEPPKPNPRPGPSPTPPR